MGFVKRFLDNMEKKAELQAFRDSLLRRYNDVAVILWYRVAFDSVLSFKQQKMMEQNEPFRRFEWGNHTMIFGPIKALTGQTKRAEFEAVSVAELRDLGYPAKSVKVYPDAIVVYF